MLQFVMLIMHVLRFLSLFLCLSGFAAMMDKLGADCMDDIRDDLTAYLQDLQKAADNEEKYHFVQEDFLREVCEYDRRKIIAVERQILFIQSDMQDYYGYHNRVSDAEVLDADDMKEACHDWLNKEAKDLPLILDGQRAELRCLQHFTTIKQKFFEMVYKDTIANLKNLSVKLQCMSLGDLVVEFGLLDFDEDIG